MSSSQRSYASTQPGSSAAVEYADPLHHLGLRLPQVGHSHMDALSTELTSLGSAGGTAPAMQASDSLPSSIFYHYPVCRGSLPPARWAHTAVVVNGEIYVFGGVGHSMLDDLCALDVHTMSWRAVTAQATRSKDRPEKMLGHAAAALNSKIWIFGGQSGRKFLRTLYCFDTDNALWLRYSSDSLPSARAGHSMCTVHGSVVYMFGGQGKKLYNDLYKLEPSAGTFVEVAAAGKPPCPRRGHSLTWDGRDCLVCFGGVTANGSTDAQLSVFSLSRGEWLSPQAFGPAPSPRTQHSATLLAPGIIVYFGGCSSGGTFFNDLLVLDTRAGFTWHRPSGLNTAPAPRYHHTCCLANGRLVLYGGINSKQTFEGVVLLETKFAQDISLVAEELFKMSTEASAVNTAPVTPAAAAASNAALTAMAAAQQQLLPFSHHPITSNTGTLSLAATPTQHLSLPSLQPSQPPAAQAPAPAPAHAPIQQLSSLFEAGAASTKSLEAVKVQLTDLLLRRNMEEQHLQASRKAETNESLLAKEREAKEAAMREVLQLKLQLAELEEGRTAAQQHLRLAVARSAKETASISELRAALESAQSRLAAREEELAEARLLQDSLVKELGILASRYSKLALDGQDGGNGSSGMSPGPGSEAVRRSVNGAGARGGRRSPSPGQASAGQVGGGGGGGERVLAGMEGAVAAAAAAANHSGSAQLPAVLSATPGSYGHTDDMEAHGSGGTSISLPPQVGSSVAQTASVAAPSSSSATTTATAHTLSTIARGGSSSCATGSGGGTSSCQQLLSLLSNSELQRAALLEDVQALGVRAEELRGANERLEAKLAQMRADPPALEPLATPDLEELERRLEASMRAVRCALVQRKIDEAQRRSSTEVNTCALCMEAPRGVVFSCGHQSCEPCSSKLAACPFCRATITAKIRLYDA